MGNKILIGFCLISTLAGIAQDRQNDWENPEILDKNKKGGRSFFILHQDESSAKNNHPGNFSLYQSLN